jgi:dienelactone hydrolase
MGKLSCSTYRLAAIFSAAVLCAWAGASVSAQSPFDPVQDDPKLPRVLLIGDSISIGYTVPVQQLLQGKANVHRIPVNGQYSAYGLAHLKQWLGDGKWDVIHFNWGIWDTHLLDSRGELIHSKEEGDKPGVIRTSLPEYQENLRKILDILEPTGASLIWATTTPLTCRKGDRLKDIDRYNGAAASVMQARLVAIDDLNALIQPHLNEMQSDDGCHFNPQGSEYLAKQVAERILAAIHAAKDPAVPWKVEPAGEELREGRRVVRFEHACLPAWGYAEKIRQYFYVVEPKNAGPGPLLVCLHSAGGNPDKFENGKLEMPQNVAKVAAAGDDFAGLVVNSGVGSEWWWGADEIRANGDKYQNTLTPVETRILATVEWTVRKYNIDRNRIYLRGISMGGSGTLGIGMCHGDVFAALLAGVPAGTDHAIYRLSNSPSIARQAGMAYDVPPVCVFFSQKDKWAKGTEPWLELMHHDKLPLVAAWGPWGHLNHYEMTNPAAHEFPWLTIRKDQAYPAFTNTSADEKYPGLHSDGPDQNGQINAYLRWRVLDDQPNGFSVELRLVQKGELRRPVEIPPEVTTDVTPRRLQRLRVVTDKTYHWKIEQEGQSRGSGTTVADSQGLLTIPRVKVAATPIVLQISDKN